MTILLHLVRQEGFEPPASPRRSSSTDWRGQPYPHLTHKWRKVEESNPIGSAPIRSFQGCLATIDRHLPTYGGSREIRTLDTFRYSVLAGRRLKPLGHASVKLMVPAKGLEPPLPKELRPKRSASAIPPRGHIFGADDRPRTGKPIGLSYRGIPIPVTSAKLGAPGESRTHQSQLCRLFPRRLGSDAWYGCSDLNRDALRQWILSPSCLPFHHTRTNKKPPRLERSEKRSCCVRLDGPVPTIQG